MRKLNVAIIGSLFCMAAACGGTDEGDLIEDPSVDAQADTKADQGAIPTTDLIDDIGSAGTSVTRKVFTSASAYKAYFGHKAPSTVNFSKEWVAFYSAGVENTGGYDASIERVALSNTGLTLKVTTALSSPGSDCIVTQALTKPYALVKFKKPSPRPDYVKFYKDDTTRSCGPTGPFCGGIAGIPCPGFGRCVDNPSDNCDPAHGGADCGGVCSCIDFVACMVGYHFDTDPTVCACVPNADPCAGVVCPTGSQCKNGTCTSQCDGVTCPDGQHCVVVGNAVSCQPGVQCGSNVCGTGEYCCNASCGICIKMGFFCTQQVCGPPL